MIRRHWYSVFALLAGVTVFSFAYLNRFTFPFPWNDEARFFFPALWWAEHTSLKPENLNAPNGIFWVPDGFTILFGCILKLFGHSIETARLACELMVASGVTLFAFAFKELSRSAIFGVVSTLILISPPTILASNMVRMEAPVFLLIAVAFVLHANKYYVAAASILFATLLFHPAAMIAAVGYSVSVWLTRARSPIRIMTLDLIVCFMVASALALEFGHIFSHLGLFRSHMSYQATRKTAVPMATKFFKPQGVVLLLSMLPVVLWRSRYWAELLPQALIAVGLCLYAVLGGEFIYAVYSLSLVPAILLNIFGQRCAISTGSGGVSRPPAYRVATPGATTVI